MKISVWLAYEKRINTPPCLCAPCILQYCSSLLDDTEVPYFDLVIIGSTDNSCFITVHTVNSPAVTSKSLHTLVSVKTTLLKLMDITCHIMCISAWRNHHSYYCLIYYSKTKNAVINAMNKTSQKMKQRIIIQFINYISIWHHDKTLKLD